MKSLGDRVRERRGELRLSQPALARLIGVSQQTIGELEKEPTRGTKHAVKLAAALGVYPLWLDQGVGPKEIGGGDRAAKGDGAASPSSALSGVLDSMEVEDNPAVALATASLYFAVGREKEAVAAARSFASLVEGKQRKPAARQRIATK